LGPGAGHVGHAGEVERHASCARGVGYGEESLLEALLRGDGARCESLGGRRLLGRERRRSDHPGRCCRCCRSCRPCRPCRRYCVVWNPSARCHPTREIGDGRYLTPTMARAPGPPSSLRMKLLLVLLAAGVYAGAPPVYLLLRARAAIVAGDDLLTRQRALQAAAGQALRDIVLWLALGALCAPLVISWVRRRVW